MTLKTHAGERVRRLLALCALSTIVGCASTAPEPTIPCFRVGKSKKTCMTEAAPSAERQVAARRFEPAPRALTVYIVRDRWADARHLVPIEIDGRVAQTLPMSFVRAQVAPGRHVVRLNFEGSTSSIDVEGRAGEIVVVDLAGSVWSWASSFRWEPAPASTMPERLRTLRLTGEIVSDGT